MHLALLLTKEVHDRIGCLAATVQDDKSAQPMPHSGGKTYALAAVQHGTEQAVAFESGQLTTRRNLRCGSSRPQYALLGLALRIGGCANGPNEGNFAQFDNWPHVFRRESRTKPQYASRTRRLKQDRRQASLIVRWIWFDHAPRCPLPFGRIEARSRFACRYDSDG
jgi:hypothetical protein